MEMSWPQRWFLIVFSSAGALAACCFLFRSIAFSSPARLLEEAYSEQRTLELRLAKTPHASVRVQRGKETSRLDRPESLLEAEAMIARGLRQNPEDSLLLTARGQANLLEWSYEAAITDMQEALDTQPRSALILNSLATAYFERAEAEDRFDDYGTAFDLQSRALQESPDDAVIFFNRALTAARLYLYKQSTDDWRRYISLDSYGEWSDEANQHLREVQERVDAHDKRTNVPLLTPAEFVRTVDSADSKTWEIVEPRIEEYLSVAVTNWLPEAFPVDGKLTSSSDAKQALNTLAAVLDKSHGDKWLTDFMSTPASGDLVQAIHALSNALENNRVKGDYVLGRRAAALAADTFHRAGNSAGAIRSGLEETYALRLSDAAPDCLRKIAQLSAQADARQYQAIQIQMKLESVNCLALENRLDRSREFAIKAYEAAVRNHYWALALSATALLSHSEYSKGENDEGWRLCEDGLRRFWSSAVSAHRVYGLYVVLDLLAKRQRLWHLDSAIGSQIVSSLPSDEDPLLRAEEYLSLAHASEMAHDLHTARENLVIANHLLDSSPQTQVTDNYRLDMEIYLAWLDGRIGNAQTAITRLATVEPKVAKISNEVLSEKYHRAVGEMYGQSGNIPASEEELDVAVLIAEQQRSSLEAESDRLSWARESEELYRDLVETKFEAQDPSGALAVLEFYRGAALRTTGSSTGSENAYKQPGYGSKHALEPVLSSEIALLNRIQPALGNRAILTYSVLSRGLAIWVYDRQGLTVRWVDKDPEYIEMLARRFGELCATPSSSLPHLRTAARRLYQILVAPVADRIGPQQALIIEADERLSHVSFQALIDPTDHYLAENHALVYSPGLRYLANLPGDDTPITADTRALVVASAGGGTDLGLRPLSDTISEAQNVAQRFNNPLVLLEDSATILAVRDGLSHSGVFHFAGHAAYSEGRTGLQLVSAASDETSGVLDATSLRGNSLPALQLAVLSACSTENGTRGRKLDAASLVGAFLRAGVPHVVATRWDVDSQASAALMVGFYDRLLSGESVSQALTSAEASVRQRYMHPYYWAAFDAFGQN